MKRLEDTAKDVSGLLSPDFSSKTGSAPSGASGTASIDHSSPGAGPTDTGVSGNAVSNISGGVNGKIMGSIPDNASSVVENGVNVGKLGGALVYIIINRLYYVIAIPAMIITYNVFLALNKPNDKGVSIFDRIFEVISKVLDNLTEISGQCPELIGDFPKFLECIGF